jgi:TonB-dependent starch-binding outer membrane protein SusC
MHVKIITILLLAACLCRSEVGHAQRVTLDLKDVPLKVVFMDIKAQTGYDFLYSDETLAGIPNVTIRVSDVPIEAALSLCVKNPPLECTIRNHTILVTRVAAAGAAATPSDIHGRVIDTTGAPLAGASVIVKGTGQVVQTDSRGGFVIKKITGLATLIISYTGFEARTFAVGKETADLVFILHRSDNPLDEAKVIAYGSTSQRYSVGAVSTVTAKDIGQQPINNVLEALEGRVPGLLVSSASGAPGAMITTQIRGQNNVGTTMTYNGVPPSGMLAGYDQPLYVIDGIPFAAQNNDLSSVGGAQFVNLATGNNPQASFSNFYGGMSPLSLINPRDIESVSVLKDADATSIYGSQGQNGVILITTKKGRPGKTRGELYFTDGPVRNQRSVPMMNTHQYLQMRRQAIFNDGLSPTDTAAALDLLVFDTTKNTDWYHTMYSNVAQHLNFQGSLSGGTGGSTFLVSGSDVYTTYPLPGGFSDNKISMHSTYSYRSTDQRLFMDMGADFSYDNNNSSSNPSALAAFRTAPDMPDYLDKQGNLVWSYKGYGLPYGKNPMAFLKQPNDLKNFTFLSHLHLGYNLLPWMTIEGTAGYNQLNTQAYSATTIASQNPATGALGSASFGTQQNGSLDIEPQVTIKQTIRKGQLTVLLGGNYKETLTTGFNVQGKGFPSDALLHSIASAGSIQGSSIYSIYKYTEGFGRLNYIWDRKYVFNFTANRDGSSNFGPGHRIGNFGSAGAGWIFSEEKFFKKALPFIDFAKISGNYGTAGSDAIAPYQYQPNWAAVGVYNAFQGMTGYSPANLFDPAYSWAVNKKLAASLELGFFQERIYLDISAYRDRCGNQLVSYTLPSTTGFYSIVQNAPYSVQNTGLEISIQTKNVETKNFKWTSNFNISGNRNKLLSFPGLATSTYNDVFAIGKSINMKMLSKYAGVDPATGFFQFYTAKGQLADIPPLYDMSSLNNVGGDATQSVSLVPKFYGGLSNTFYYKNFSLTCFLEFKKQLGYNYLFSLYGNAITGPGAMGYNQPAELLKLRVWQKPGDIADLPMFSTGGGPNINSANFYQNMYAFTYSTGGISDASYIRLKTLSLAYNFPAAGLRKLGIQGASLYLNAQNLLTITRYKVGDPETQSLYTIPPQRTIVVGCSLNL